MRFLLCNRDKELALLDITNNIFSILEIMDKNGFEALIRIHDKKWLEKRAQYHIRPNLTKLANSLKVNTIEEYLRLTKGVSLSDTLWLKSGEETWREVNPYQNKINNQLSDILLYGKEIELSNIEHLPEFQLGGSFEKCYTLKNNKLYLVKASGERYSSVSGNESCSEIIYNQVCEFLGIDKSDYVQYTLDDKNLVYCEMFTSEKYGLLEFDDSIFRNLNFKNILKLFNKSAYKKRFRDMVILDCITFNIDRHQGNYGFVIDNDSFKIKAMAPIYDNNLCALTKISFKQDESDILRDVARVFSQGMGIRFLDIVKYVMYQEMLEKLKLRAGEFRLDTSRLKGINDFDENRSKWLEKLINLQMTKIVESIGGRDKIKWSAPIFNIKCSKGIKLCKF